MIKTIKEYLETLTPDRKKTLTELHNVIIKNLPKGFVEEINYNIPGYVVPHTLYSKGYHVNPKLPLPFINIASQKNHIAFYHLGIYSNEKLLIWFKEQWPKHSSTKLDMGKSCIRFKRPEDIPFKLIGELVSKITPQEWIKIYENSLKK